ncbi:hexitol phosphatase HxpB [Flavobacterium polysaccharolyticum]|uniref:Hexitol phosphatase HxpB n=1 Tax=Flavobacterium polysaccharolyticum TaxID=3133148 RepID=A0ABU9NJJ9_9FLAO
MTIQKAVIFDMDGVIIDSENLWKKAEKEVFTSLGVNVTHEDSELTKSMTTFEVTKFWFDKFPWEDKSTDIVEHMVISRVIELIDTEDCKINGIKEFIERLKAKNYKIGLATNSPYKIIPKVLQKFDIQHLFDTVSSAEFEDNGKPAPAIYLTTAEKLNVTTNNCIAIEDSYSGMLAAKNAGMTVVAFTNGNKDLDFEIADYKIDAFDHFNIDIFN